MEAVSKTKMDFITSCLYHLDEYEQTYLINYLIKGLIVHTDLDASVTIREFINNDIMVTNEK